MEEVAGSAPTVIVKEKAEWRGGVCCGVRGKCAVCCARSGGTNGGVIGILCLEYGLTS